MNSIEFISPAWDRIQRSSEDNIAFSLIVKSVQNVPKSPSPAQETHRSYIAQIHFYDAVYKQFFGRICRGGTRKEEFDSDTICWKEEFYFHTSFVDDNILLVIEVLEIVNCEEKCLGWTSMRLYKQNDDGLGANSGSFGLGLFYGSCCSLIYVDSSPDFAPSSEKILGCQVDVCLSDFKPLVKIAHLVSENYVVSQRELVPGVRNLNDNSCTLRGARKLKRILLKPCTSCTLQDLTINITTTIDQFETELCQHLTDQNLQNITNLEVFERRLQIGIHNGCDFIEEPHTHHLVSGVTTRLTRTASGKRHNWSFRSRQSRHFTLRNKIILNNIPAESGIKLIFVVEYVVNVTSSDAKFSGSRKLNVAVYGACWEIFPECFKSSFGSKEINLDTGNDVYIQKLLKILLYNSDFVSNETPSIKFSYQIGKKNKSKSRVSVESSDSVSTQTNASVAVEREGNEKIDLANVGDVSEVVGEIAQRFTPWVASKASGSRLPRDLHCFLASFPPIVDRWGQPATLVDVGADDAVDLFAEEKDLLKRNEIVLQFLAFKKINRSSKTRAVTIAFQFFKFDVYFTESLFLESTNSPDQPCILKQLEEGKLKQISDIRFVVDPSRWTHRTHKEFIDYLAKFCLHFDVFDAESQFYLGQCQTSLKNLCRGGREAVEWTQELEIVAPLDPHANDSPGSGFSREISGYLYCRLGNVGQTSDPICKFQIPVSVVKSETRITQSGSGHVIKARSLRDVRENEERDNKNWEERLRKLNRMEIVRAAHPDEKIMKLFQEKTRVTSLQTVQLYREEQKHKSITQLLENNLTTRHSIDTTLAEIAFFEFTLTNPFSRPLTVTIDISDPDLKLVESPTEWEHLKRANACSGVVEPGFVSYDSTRASPHVFLHANESVNVPFKFQTFAWDIKYKVWTDKVACAAAKMRKAIRVGFNSDGSGLISVLVVDVQIFHPPVEKSFVFFQDAESRLQRCIPVAGVSSGQVFAACSDSTATTDVVGSEDLKRFSLVLKIGVGSVGDPTNLFVFIFTNPFLTSPTSTWRVCIMPLHRIDLTCHLGQSRKCHLVIKGDNLDRKTAIYLSDADITVDQTHLYLAANQTQQIVANIKNTALGSRSHFVNLVDLNAHHVIQSWIICVTANPPIISKVFRVDLQLRRESHKKIHFLNPYDEARVFNLHCTHPDVMKMKESVLKLGPKQKAVVAIYFPVMALPGPNEILLFIDGESGKNEDIYKIQIVYDVK